MLHHVHPTVRNSSSSSSSSKMHGSVLWWTLTSVGAWDDNVYKVTPLLTLQSACLPVCICVSAYACRMMRRRHLNAEFNGWSSLVIAACSTDKLVRHVTGNGTFVNAVGRSRTETTPDTYTRFVWSYRFHDEHCLNHVLCVCECACVWWHVFL